MSTVYTGGTFDLFHFGHKAFLAKCKELAGYGSVFVSLNTDEFIKEFKGKPPVMTYKERRESIIALAGNCVDGVIPNTGGADSKPAILKVKPDIIAIGSDWARKDYYKQMSFTQDWLDKQNIMLVYIPYTWSISATELKRRLNEN